MTILAPLATLVWDTADTAEAVASIGLPLIVGLVSAAGSVQIGKQAIAASLRVTELETLASFRASGVPGTLDETRQLAANEEAEVFLTEAQEELQGIIDWCLDAYALVLGAVTLAVSWLLGLPSEWRSNGVIIVVLLFAVVALTAVANFFVGKIAPDGYQDLRRPKCAADTDSRRGRFYDATTPVNWWLSAGGASVAAILVAVRVAHVHGFWFF